MARMVWCRWCSAEHLVNAGDFPAVCETCGNAGRWTTQPGTPLLSERKGTHPRVPYDLNGNDLRLLKQLRIAAEA